MEFLQSKDSDVSKDPTAHNVSIFYSTQCYLMFEMQIGFGKKYEMRCDPEADFQASS
jgi:hypothetical protein